MFDHEWLSEHSLDKSRRLTAENGAARRQHHVPRMYLDRWALDGLVQPVQIDAHTSYRPQPPKVVARKNNFYTLPQSGSTVDVPLRWIEAHLGVIESHCAPRLVELDAWGGGVVTDIQLKRDLSVFLGLQVTRTLGSRERATALINAPADAKRQVLLALNPFASERQLDESMRNCHDDPQEEALDLMIKDVRNVLAEALYDREWALYRTAAPIITCDEPVVLVAGPPFARSDAAGAGTSAAILYPLNPHCVLVMLRAPLRHRGPYRLDFAETASVNLEIAAAATKTVFERPGDDIAAALSVPRRPEIPELTDTGAGSLSRVEAVALIQGQAGRRSRWVAGSNAPDWPVSRWYGS